MTAYHDYLDFQGKNVVKTIHNWDPAVVLQRVDDEKGN